MTSFQFAAPWVLSLALIIPALLVAYHFLSGQRTRPSTMNHAAAGMVRNLPRSWRITWRPVTTVLRVLAIMLMVIGMARPQIVQGKETITGEGVDIALALDISGSMASLDFEPQNRLEAAKDVIGDFISERPYDKIGMVIFSSEAFSQSPLTLDHNMVARSLDQIQLASDLGLEDGTAIGLGIANAANMLTNSDAESKVVILLTDGVNNSGQVDPLTAAEAAKALGIKIYTIGAGRPGEVPVPVPSMFGGTKVAYQESVLDEATLQQVADISGGKYFRAQDTSGQLEKSQVEVQIFNQYHELLAWLLIPALGLLLLEVVLRNSLFRKVP